MKLKDMLQVIKEGQIVEIIFVASNSPAFHGTAYDALKLNKYIINSTVAFCKVYISSVLSIAIK